MELAFALLATTLFVVVLEGLLRGFEDCSSTDPRDSFPRSIGATFVWMALLTPLFFSYA